MSPVNPTLSFDMLTAKSAFESLKAELEAMRPEQVEGPSIDVRSAARVAWTVVKVIGESGVRRRLSGLSPDVLDPTLILRLEPLAWAAWYASDRFQSALDRSRSAKVPPEMLQEAIEVRARMLKVAEHCLGEELETAGIRRGNGYNDLVSDLNRLGELYVAYEALFSRDGVHFRAADVQAANRLVVAIAHELSDEMQAETKKWADMQARSYTLLRRAYERIRAAVLFVYSEDRSMAARVPSLVSASRAPWGSVKEDPQPAASEAVAGGEATTEVA